MLQSNNFASKTFTLFGCIEGGVLVEPDAGSECGRQVSEGLYGWPGYVHRTGRRAYIDQGQEALKEEINIS